MLTRRTFVQRLIGGTSLTAETVGRVVGGAALSVFGVERFHAQGATLFPVQDATLHQAPGDSTDPSAVELQIGSSGGNRVDAALRFDELQEFYDVHHATSTFSLRLTLSLPAPFAFGALVAYVSTQEANATGSTSPWGDDDAGLGTAMSASLSGESPGTTIDIDVTALIALMVANNRTTIRVRRDSLADDAMLYVAALEAPTAALRPVIVTTLSGGPSPSPSPLPTPTPSASSSLPTPTPTPTPTPMPSAALPTPTPSASSAIRTPTPSSTSTPTPTPTPFQTPTPTPSATGATPSPSPLPPVVLQLFQQITGREGGQSPQVTLLLRTAMRDFQSHNVNGRLRVLLTALIDQLTQLNLQFDAPLNVGADRAAFDGEPTQAECILAIDAPAGTYFVRGRVVTTFGLGPPSNEITFVLGGSCETGPPPAPGPLSATVDGVNVSLSWVEAPTATSYIVEAGSSPGSSDLVRSNVGFTTTLAATNVPGTYYVRVRGTNACGVGPASNEVEVRLTSALERPGAPFDLRAVVSGSTVTLSWAPPLAGGPVRAYFLGAGTARGGIDAGVQTLMATSLVVRDVPPGRYFVRVEARNDAGAGPATPDLVVDVT